MALLSDSKNIKKTIMFKKAFVLIICSLTLPLRASEIGKQGAISASAAAKDLVLPAEIGDAIRASEVVTVRTSNTKLVTDYFKANPEYITARQDWSQRTPLIIAALHGNVTLVQMLLDKKADVNAQERDTDIYKHGIRAFHDTALTMATRSRIQNKKDILDIMHALVHNGANIHHKGTSGDMGGAAALSGAVSGKNYDCVKWLVENRADIEINELDGLSQTPLFYAVKHYDKDIFDYLLQHNADPLHQDYFGKTILDIAKYYCPDKIEHLRQIMNNYHQRLLKSIDSTLIQSNILLPPIGTIVQNYVASLSTQNV